MRNEQRNRDDPPMPACKQCGEEFNGDSEGEFCPDCREQNAPDEEDDDAEVGLGIL